MKPIKLNDSSNETWIVSDLHLNHNKNFIFEKRGFVSIQDHNDTIINTINDKVKPDDNLISLGDFCLMTKEDEFEKFRERINCKNIYMIFGNHPNPIYKIFKREVFSKYGEDIEVYPFRYKNMIFIGYHMDFVIQGKYVVINHFPLDIWDHMKDGAYMLCGHSHYSFERTHKDSTDGKILDCGWEGHGKPYNFREIIEIMEKKTIRVSDHHKNNVLL